MFHSCCCCATGCFCEDHSLWRTQVSVEWATTNTVSVNQIKRLYFYYKSIHIVFSIIVWCNCDNLYRFLCSDWTFMKKISWRIDRLFKGVTFNLGVNNTCVQLFNNRLKWHSRSLVTNLHMIGKVSIGVSNSVQCSPSTYSFVFICMCVFV